MKPNHEQDAIRHTQWVVWGVGMVLTGLAWSWQGPGWAVGTLVGATLAGLNLWVLTRSVSRLLLGMSASWAAVAAAKFVALLGATYFALRSPYVAPLAFTLGLVSLPLGIVFGALFVARPASSDADISDHQQQQSPHVP